MDGHGRTASARTTIVKATIHKAAYPYMVPYTTAGGTEQMLLEPAAEGTTFTLDWHAGYVGSGYLEVGIVFSGFPSDYRGRGRISVMTSLSISEPVYAVIDFTVADGTPRLSRTLYLSGKEPTSIDDPLVPFGELNGPLPLKFDEVTVLKSYLGR